MSSYTTTNPVTGRVERQFDSISDSDVQSVISRSDTAFTSWREVSLADRAQALRRTGELYRERLDELAATITTEMGKTIAEAKGEVKLAASIYRWYADHGPELLADEVLDPQGAEESLVQTAPVGALVGVMPWNFPYYQVARFAAPNLMAGNTIILKHAGICAASSALMADALHDAGVPDDAYINVYASTDQVADMIADPRVRGVSLTGSEKAGAAVAEVAARNLKKAVLELGGSDPYIVLDAADVGVAATKAAAARLGNAGQACNSPKRFIVLDKHFDGFLDGVVTAFDSLTIGDPTESGTDMGPLSSVEARDTVVAQVRTAVDQGATLHTGGTAIDGDGAFMRPAVLSGITPEMDVYSEEIFGPVAMVYRADSIDDAVRIANDVDFGLSGSVWSPDIDQARDVADRLDVGMAYVNEHGTTRAGLPFGGVKRSGFGRELGRWGMSEFVNTKLRRTSSA